MFADPGRRASVWRRNVLCVVVALSFVLPSFSIMASSGDDKAEVFDQERIEISLNGYVFDPLYDPQILDGGWRLDRPSGHYIVQFFGEIYPEHRRALEDAGAEIIGYVPNYAYLVDMDSQTREKVELLGVVRWVGNFDPAYKVERRVMDLLGYNPGEIRLAVSLFDSSNSGSQGLLNPESNMFFPQGLTAFPEPGVIPPGYAQLRENAPASIFNPLDMTGTRVESDAKPFIHTPIERELGQFVLDHRFNRLSNGVFDEKSLVMYNDILMESAQRFIFESFVDGIGGHLIEWKETNQAVVVVPASIIPFLAYMKPVSYISLMDDHVTFMDNIRGAEITNAMGAWAAGYDGSYSTVALRDAGLQYTHTQACAEILMSKLYGMMPDGTLQFFSWNTPDSTVMFDMQNAGSNIIVNPWGSQDDGTGEYTSVTRDRDQHLRNNREILFLWATGCGEMVSYHATGKNVLTVGGVMQGSNLLSFADDYHALCGYGVTDGRVKPDMVGYADKITTETYGTNGFGGSSGAVSMVGGFAGLVHEMLSNDYFNTGPMDPRATTVKAMLIANAYQYPTSQVSRERQGWGFPKMDSVLEEPHGLIVNEDTALNTGQNVTYTIATAGPLKISLVWSDAPALAGATPTLVNDLDLEVYEVSTGRTYYGNNGMGNALWTAHGTSDNTWRGTHPDSHRDGLNNVENVFIGTAGGTYEVTVKARHVPQGPQDFALVASGVPYTVANLRVDKQVYAGYEEATITLKDASANVNNPYVVDYPVVRVTSEYDPVGVDVVLTEVDGRGFPAINTDTYQGRVRFNPPSATGEAWSGKSYGNNHDPTHPAIIAVNPMGDSITVEFEDTDPAPTRYPQAVARVECTAPRMSNVHVSNVGYTTIGMSWETDKPSVSTLFVEVVYDPDKFNNDDDYDMWDIYSPATLDDIRNGRSMSLHTSSTTTSTSHEITMIQMLPGEEHFMWISSEDTAGNIRADTNGGDFYRVQTWEQPFEIVIWQEDPLWGIGGVVDQVSIAHAGYRARFKWKGYNGSPTSYNWNPDHPWGAYGNEFQPSTWGEWWTDMVAAQNTSIPNIVIYSSGGSGSDAAVGQGTSISPYDRTDLTQLYYGINDPWDRCLYEQAKRDKLAEFHDAGGNIFFTGSGLTESAVDYGYTQWMYDYAKVIIGTAPTSTQNKDLCDYDVSYGLIGATTNDDRWAATLHTVPGGHLDLPPITYGEGYMTLSGDVLAGGAPGTTLEYRWGNHLDGAEPPSPGYVGFSYEGGDTKIYTAPGGFIDFSYMLMGYMQNSLDEYGGPAWLYKNHLMPWYLGEHASGYYGVNGTITSGATPLENATVQAFSASNPDVVVGATMTNADGTYYLPLLQGTYNIVASKGGYTTSVPLSRTADNPYTPGVNFDLGAASYIEGYVILEDPSQGYRTIEGLRVKAEGDITTTTTTGADGYYKIDGLPGGLYTVTAWGEKHVNAEYPYTYTDIHIAYVYTYTEETSVHNITLATSTISGRVTDSSTGAPVYGANIVVWETPRGDVPIYGEGAENRTVIHSAMTQQDGTYLLSGLAPSTYYVQAQANGRITWTVWDRSLQGTVELEQPYGYMNQTWENRSGLPYTPITTTIGMEVSGIDFSLETSLGRVYGYVQNSFLEPLSGAFVKFELTSPQWLVGHRGTTVTVYTDSNGFYEAYVPNGTYNIRASKAGSLNGTYSPETTSQVVIAGGNHQSDFLLLLALGCSGTVLIIHEVMDGVDIWNDPGHENDAARFNDLMRDAVATIGLMDMHEIYMIYEEDENLQLYLPQFSDLFGWDMVIFNGYIHYVPDLNPSLIGGNDYRWADAVMQYLDTGGSFFYSHPWIDYISDHGDFQTEYMRFTGSYVGNTYMTRADVLEVGGPITSNLPTQKALVYDGYHSWEEVDSLQGMVDVFNGYDGSTSLGSVAARTDGLDWKTFGSSFFFWEYDSTLWGGDADYLQLIENLVLWGAISKPQSPPILSDAKVTPSSGPATTAFQYSVLWTDAEGDWPEGDTIEMVIDEGTAYEYVVYLASTGQGPQWSYKHAANVYGDQLAATPPASATAPTTALTPVANLNDQGANYLTSTSSSNGYYATQRITFTVTENPATLDRISVTYVGDLAATQGTVHGGALYLWNYATGAADQLASTTAQGFVTLSGTKTSPADYISGNTVTVFIQHATSHTGPMTRRTGQIVSDHIRLGIRTAGDSTEAGMEFTYTLPGNYFAGREGEHTYRFRNNGDGKFDAVGQTGTLVGPTVPDGTPPVVTVDHRTPTVDEGKPIVVYANATDNVGLGVVKLYYRIGAEGTFVSKPLHRENGIWRDVYMGTIPRPSTPETIYYYVTATDLSGNHAFDDNSGGYYIIGIDLVVDPFEVPVENLSLVRSASDVVLTWDHVKWGYGGGLYGFEVYRSTDRFAEFPLEWDLLGWVDEQSFTDTGAYGDTNTYYYVVKPLNWSVLYSTPSNIVVKQARTFARNPGSTNIMWVSIPYNSGIARASDLVMAIEGGLGEGNNTRIDTVLKWDPVRQRTEGFMYRPNPPSIRGWNIGTDFEIAPGDGIAIGLSSIATTFTWVVTGTDVLDPPASRTFERNASSTNVMWVSIGPGTTYTKASDIVMAIEGGLGEGNNTRIDVVWKWDPVAQTTVTLSYTPNPPANRGWNAGVDFDIAPGDGIALGLSATAEPFEWEFDIMEVW